ncbi:5' nucleotidase [Vibrio phage 1.121.O._10N.286.46.C4]|nr:5' nucleotidase [Vibrio phage 1.121.O._10N.286.46.C4]
MPRLTIGIDVDLTVTEEVLTKWVIYMLSIGKLDKEVYRADNPKLEYNLTKYFPDICQESAWNFWRKEDLYDDVDCLPDAKVVIKDLYEAGVDIVWVSYCMGCPEHIRSKIKMLKREFPFIAENDFNFIAAKKKHYAAVDIMVDDRNSVLQGMPDTVVCLKKSTPYTQDVELTREHTVVMDWYDISKVVEDILEGE